MAELVIDKTSDVDTTTPINVMKCAWEKDRFTTARLTTQRGDDITIPLSGLLEHSGADMSFRGNTSGNINSLQVDTDGTNIKGTTGGGSWLATEGLRYNGGLDYSGGITLEDLRLAIGQQRYREIMNRAGARYGEYARAIFGVNNPDARLQIPEYLGGYVI